MTGWIESITELNNVGRVVLTFSFLGVKCFIPDNGIYYILVLFAVFMMFCVWDDIRSENRNDLESDIDPK
jgi:hypothetical protein